MLVGLHRGLVMALEQLESVKVKEEAGYHVFQRHDDGFLGLISKVLCRVLSLLQGIRGNI